MAQYSYVYPDALILHHQISSRSAGTLVQQREQLTELEEWWRRLAGPIIKKLKIKTLSRVD